MIRQESYFVYKVWIILVTQIKNYIFWVYKEPLSGCVVFIIRNDLYAVRIAKLGSS